MKIILDNNILFSLINPASVNSYLFSSINAEFFAPEFIQQEFKKYMKECLKKSGLSKQEFEIRKKEIFSKITFKQFREYKKFLKKVIAVLEDKEDSPYLALALSLKAIIWSNDSHLKRQNLTEVLTTSEILDRLLKNEI